MSDIIRPSDDIKRRLLAGEPLTSAQTSEEYGVSKALLGSVLSKLKGEGHTFTEQQVPGLGNPKQYRITTPTNTDIWGKGENVVSLQANKKAKAAKPTPAPKPPAAPKPRKPKPLDVPVPTLGATLRVALLAVNDDGVVTIGINNGTQSWMAEVIGYTKREEQFDGN